MFGKEKTFEEVTGMTEDEFKAQSKEVKRLKEADEARSAETATMKTQLEETKASLLALQNPEPPPNPNAPPKPTGFYEDPDKAFAERIAPFAQHTLNTNAKLEEMTARSKYGKEYTLWGEEISKMVEGHQNIADKGNPKFYENIVNIVKGKHMGEILEAERKGQSLFTESATGGHVGSSSEPGTNLSREQLEAAKRMGMTPTEFESNYNAIMESRGVRIGNA